jgi:hypothetical protein
MAKSNITNCSFTCSPDNFSMKNAEVGDGVYIQANNVAFVDNDLYLLYRELEEAVRDSLVEHTQIRLDAVQSVLGRIDDYMRGRAVGFQCEFIGRTLETDFFSPDVAFPEESPILE